MNTVLKPLALALLCYLGIACETPGPGPGSAPASPRGVPAADSVETLRAGDKIQVSLADLPMGTISAEATISEDGKITLHLDQTFQAVGKSRTKLEAEIRTRYVPSFYTKMTVTVKQEDRFVFVGGFVRQPNRYPYTTGLTVLKAISSAGDFSEFGDKTKVTVTRSDGRKETMDCKRAIEDPSLDRALFPGDRIYVPRRFF